MANVKGAVFFSSGLNGSMNKGWGQVISLAGVSTLLLVLWHCWLAIIPKEAQVLFWGTNPNQQ